MIKVKKIKCKEIGIVTAYIPGKEEYGFCFFFSPTAPVVGCQCSKCYAIVWVDTYKNKILSEKPPKHLPESGIECIKYHKEQIKRLLDSMPICPSCGKNQYEYLTNMSTPKYQNGRVFISADAPLLKTDMNSNLEAWILDED